MGTTISNNKFGSRSTHLAVARGKGKSNIFISQMLSKNKEQEDDNYEDDNDPENWLLYSSEKQSTSGRKNTFSVSGKGRFQGKR